MQKITLYRFTRPDGGVTTSLVKPDGEYTELFRLVADDGYTLTDGVNFTSCIDTDNPGAWAEVTDTENPNEATAEDYQAALREMGVEV
jgi:hypothetical protein